MIYNPTINCAAYSLSWLSNRLADLKATAAASYHTAPKREKEIARIEAHLLERVQQHNQQQNERVAQGRRAESYAELKARTYPSQMARPDAPHVPARVGPNTRGGSAASLSYGFTK